jgi:hypothetical protein
MAWRVGLICNHQARWRGAPNISRQQATPGIECGRYQSSRRFPSHASLTCTMRAAKKTLAISLPCVGKSLGRRPNGQVCGLTFGDCTGREQRPFHGHPDEWDRRRSMPVPDPSARAAGVQNEIRSDCGAMSRQPLPAVRRRPSRSGRCDGRPSRPTFGRDGLWTPWPSRAGCARAIRAGGTVVSVFGGRCTVPPRSLVRLVALWSHLSHSSLLGFGSVEEK